MKRRRKRLTRRRPRWHPEERPSWVAQLEVLRDRLGRNERVAKLLGVSTGTISRWRVAGVRIRERHRDRLERLPEFVDWLIGEACDPMSPLRDVGAKAVVDYLEGRFLSGFLSWPTPRIREAWSWFVALVIEQHRCLGDLPPPVDLEEWEAGLEPRDHPQAPQGPPDDATGGSP